MLHVDTHMKVHLNVFNRSCAQLLNTIPNTYFVHFKPQLVFPDIMQNDYFSNSESGVLRFVSDWSCSASLTGRLPSGLFPLISRTFPTLDVLCHVSVMCCVVCYIVLFCDVP
jgi:hypothetical protein